MAKILGLLPAALIAAQNNMSAAAFARLMREMGEGARTQDIQRLMKIANEMVAKHGDEMFRDIRLAPIDSEITPWPSKGATGIRQNVSVIVRERSTGNLRVVPYSAYSQEGLTRESALAAAIGSYTGNNEAYNSDVVGAIHAGTYEYTPSGF